MWWLLPGFPKSRHLNPWGGTHDVPRRCSWSNIATASKIRFLLKNFIMDGDQRPRLFEFRVFLFGPPPKEGTGLGSTAGLECLRGVPQSGARAWNCSRYVAAAPRCRFLFHPKHGRFIMQHGPSATYPRAHEAAGFGVGAFGELPAGCSEMFKLAAQRVFKCGCS